MVNFNLPQNCKTNKFIPKETIYKFSEANEQLKKIFIEGVEKIKHEYAFNVENSNIDKYIKENEKFEEVHFLRIFLKVKKNENKILKTIHSIIPKETILILEQEDEILVSVSNTKIAKDNIIIENIYNTEWLDKKDPKLVVFDYKNMDLTNMKSFYNSYILAVKRINLSKDLEGERLVDIANIEKLEILNKEIIELKKLRKKETQTNRIAELQIKLMNKLKKRKELL